MLDWLQLVWRGAESRSEAPGRRREAVPVFPTVKALRVGSAPACSTSRSARSTSSRTCRAVPLRKWFRCGAAARPHGTGRELLLALGLTAAGARVMHRRPRVPPVA